MDRVSLEGKTALVTGAGSGIGQAIATELARCGAYTVVNYRSNEAGATATLDQIKRLGGDGQIIRADVSRAGDVEAMFGSLKRVDILVNNAGGLVKRASLSELTEALWDEVMAINVKSTFLCCRAALPLMRGRGWGRIVNMSSLAAHDGGGTGASAYAAAKAAIATFSKGLAKELAPDGITVNCVAPGLIATAFHDTHTAPDARRASVKTSPRGARRAAHRRGGGSRIPGVGHGGLPDG